MAGVGDLHNSEVIYRALKVLGRVGDRFLTKRAGPDADWTSGLRAKDTAKGYPPKKYSATDPAVVLRALTELQLLDGPNRRVLSGHASELREFRNNQAHGGDFSDEDAARAIDTTARLTKALGATEDELQALVDLASSTRRKPSLASAEGTDHQRTLREGGIPNPPESAEPRTEQDVEDSSSPPVASTERDKPAATIQCRSCGTTLSTSALLCSNPNCGRDPRQEPVIAISAAAPPSFASPRPEGGGTHLAGDPAGPPTVGRLRITLPNHVRVELDLNDRLILGRQSPHPEVARAFEGYEEVSRSHVRLINDALGPALIMLGDTGGQFGTFIGGQRLPNDADVRVPLHHGDSIRLGDRSTFRIEVLGI